MADQKPAQPADEVVGRIVESLLNEYSIIRDDSSRIKWLVTEAAETLRSDFLAIDSLVRESGLSGEALEQFNETCRRVISTLQFEDIISQIMEFHLTRAGATIDILNNLYEEVATGEDNHAPVDGVHPLLIRLQQEIEQSNRKHTASESVLQQDLAVGDIELF